MGSSLIEEAFGHPARIRVLRTLHKPGSGYMSLNQLAKVTSLNVMTLSRTLKALQELGLANYVKAGTSQLWRLSEGYSIMAIGPILDAMEKMPSMIEKLQEMVSGLLVPPEIEKIILFGSVARGENETGSDADLLLIRSNGKTTPEAFLSDLTEKISRNFWMNPSFLIKTSSEFKKMTPELQKNIQEGIVLYEKKSNQGRPKG